MKHWGILLRSTGLYQLRPKAAQDEATARVRPSGDDLLPNTGAASRKPCNFSAPALIHRTELPRQTIPRKRRNEDSATEPPASSASHGHTNRRSPCAW